MRKKTKAILTEETAQTLLHLRKTDPYQFYAHIIALRERGWPLRALGEPFNVSRVAVSNWEEKAYSDPKIVLLSKSTPVPDLPIDGHGSRTKAAKITPDVPKADRERLAALSPVASKNTRWSAKDSPERQASEELNRMIYHYHVKKKVPAAAIARYAGVSRRAIMQRIYK